MIAKLVIGRLPRPNGHFIGTKFLFVGGPLVPLESWYVMKETSRSDQWGRRVTYTYDHFTLRLSPASVILGYLRVWLPYLALATPFILMYGESVDFGRPELFVSYGLLALWLLLLIVPGFVLRGPPTGDAARLATLTGISVDPERMTPQTRMGLRTSLLERAGVVVRALDQVRADAPGWDEATRAYVWGACALMGFEDPAWGAVAREIA